MACDPRDILRGRLNATALDDIAARSPLAKMNLYCTFMTVIFALVLSCTASGGSTPQDNSSSKGKLKVVVVDWQEARIAGPKILFRSSKFKAEVKANEAGEFETEVPVGVYEVIAQTEGFKKFRQKGVRVEEGKTTSVKIQLTVTSTILKVPRDGVYL